MDLEPSAGQPVLPPPARTSFNLLVVDDEEGPRQSLRMVFRNDFSVHTVDSGEKAVEFVKENTVHVAILDIRMSGSSGIEVLQELKRIDPLIEVIMLTAYETLETARQALRLGACDYLSKPFDLTTIRSAAARALHLRKIADTVSSTSQRLHDLNARLEDIALREEMARTTTEIYAGVLHDINNPLTVISGYVELLEEKLKNVTALHGDDLDKVRTNLEYIGKQVATCTAIATRYLRFIHNQDTPGRTLPVNQVIGDLQALLKAHPEVHLNRLCVKPLDIDACARIFRSTRSRARPTSKPSGSSPTASKPPPPSALRLTRNPKSCSGVRSSGMRAPSSVSASSTRAPAFPPPSFRASSNLTSRPRPSRAPVSASRSFPASCKPTAVSCI
jgi:CheY-like chemotaxis protein